MPGRNPWEGIMGNRSNLSLADFVPHPLRVSAGVGEHFCVIGPDLLVQRGDEYLEDSGHFVPFTLEALGRRVPRGLLARRPV